MAKRCFCLLCPLFALIALWMVCVAPLSTVALAPDKASDGCIPSLLSPVAGAVMDNGRTDGNDEIIWEFTWSECPTADAYALQVIWSGASLYLIDVEDLPDARYLHTSAGYIADANRLDWRWRVMARNNGIWDGWSDWGSFDVEPLNSDAPQTRTFLPMVRRDLPP